jgi:putative heme-binding domain-containing protein
MRYAKTVTALCGLLAAWWTSAPAQAPQAPTAQWIWFNAGNPTQSAPAETVYFRRTFTLDHNVEQATLDITADDAFQVWLNGTLVGAGDTWQRVFRFDVGKNLVKGSNVLAVAATNTSVSPAGLMAHLRYVPTGQPAQALVTDGAWKVSKTPAAGWQKIDFDDTKWAKVLVLGPVGKTAPWHNQGQAAGGKPRFTVPAGFKVEPYVKLPDNDPKFSLVNMCFDAKGRLLVSRENGPIYLCTAPDKAGVLQEVRVYCDLVKNSQGMCWVKDALLLVGNGPMGTGLYRCRDTKGQDKIDDVQLLHQFQGGMGEHGPHAVLHGPDDMLYVVIGNHAWAKVDKLAPNSPLTRWPTGGMGPDQGKARTTEDVLLPRLNDARGHAANILAPGGTIWRMDRDGKNVSLVAAGFRNHFDAAFGPNGELFTFDSDMEWDEGLPWYRAVRICHCPPGADFVWRTGAANTPDYYLDSLPPAAETGRGSPVGVECYDHVAFPKEYRGVFFMADWSLGIIYAVKMERTGATYQAKYERFCTGSPMPVTDLAVAPDGSLVFSVGGRNTQGGVYRISYPQEPKNQGFLGDLFTRLSAQPLSAYTRANVQDATTEAIKEKGKEAFQKAIEDVLKEGARNPSSREATSRLTMVQLHRWPLHLPMLQPFLAHREPEVRAQAVWLLGVNGFKEGKAALVEALKDADPLVRRRACEALIRAGIDTPAADVWPLLADRDRFVRHAARLVLERIDPHEWTDRLWREPNDLIAWNGVVALCHTHQAALYHEQLFARLRGGPGKGAAPEAVLDWLRTVQLALVHTKQRPAWVRTIAVQCDQLFPHKDARVNRELAILLTQFHLEKQLDRPVQARLMKALEASQDDHPQQIHYAYCLRLLTDGWTAAEKAKLAAWFEGTKMWKGGHSFTPFLENIFRETLAAYTAADRKALLAEADKLPQVTLVLAQQLQTDPQQELLPDLQALQARLAKEAPKFRGGELKQAVEDAMVRTQIRFATGADLPLLVGSLESKNLLVRGEALKALYNLDAKPKADDPVPYRALLLASGKLSPAQQQTVVEVLRFWSGRSFGSTKIKAESELKSFARWFAQTFPKEPALPNVGAEPVAESKYKMADLLEFLEKTPAGRNGDAARGKAVFIKANCAKCHKYGDHGEGVGPDLTTLAKRFKRADVLESILDPSKVISDQYRSVLITTTSGQQINGLAAVQGDTVTVLLNDASKLTLRKDEIDTQVASLISVMPERLLDTLTRQEIADLFAYLESDPTKK